MKRHNTSPLISSSKYRRCYTPIPTKFDKSVSSLLNLAAKVVAETIPYELIENRLPAIPDQLQHKIIFYSFPRKEADIYIYSSYGLLDKNSDANKKLSFYQGVSLLEKNLVQNVMQIGFHLNATVQDTPRPGLLSRKTDNLQTFHVSVTFDRCKITSVDCTCAHQGLFWCPHIVALALFRIRRPEAVQFREPISESLVRMDRNQLQKFAQYLISSHPNQVLSSAQNLVDQLLETDSSINQIYGAPDPTAGAGLTEPEPQWHLNEAQIRDQVSQQLGCVSVSEVPAGLGAMCGKVREMLRHQDSNGARLLALLTDQSLRDPRLAVFRARQAEMWPAYRELWEELARLWVCVLLCPGLPACERQRWRLRLLDWAAAEACPPQDWDYASSTTSLATGSLAAEGSVFRLALEAADLNWDIAPLQEIINDKSSGTAHVWSESLQLSCLRVSALRSNGLSEEAVRLAVAISRHLIGQRQSLPQPVIAVPQLHLQPHQPPPPPPPPPHTGCSSLSACSSFNCLFQKYSHQQQQQQQQPAHSPCCPHAQHKSPSVTSLCMMAAAGSASSSAASAVVTKTTPLYYLPHSMPPPPPPPPLLPALDFQQSPLFPSPEAVISDLTSQQYHPHQQQHQHQSPVVATAEEESGGWLGLPGNPVRVLADCLLAAGPPSESQLALRVSLAALCQARCMPARKQAQERCLSHETRLLGLLGQLPRHDPELCVVLAQAVRAELDTDHGALAARVPAATHPMHAPALFLFRWLLLFDQELAYGLVRRAMRLPLMEPLSSAAQAQTQPPHAAAAASAAASAAVAVAAVSRWPLLRRVEAAQGELALAMVQAARDSSYRLDLVLRMCDRHIHSSSGLFKLSQDICSKCFMNAHLRCAVFHLALNVAGRTLRGRSHWRRREMVQWLVSCAVAVGPVGVLHLVGHWRHYVSAKEAVLQVASSLLGLGSGLVAMTVAPSGAGPGLPPSTATAGVSVAAGGPGHHLGGVTQDERVRRHIRRMAVDAASKDPVHCGMRALSLAEKDPALFEAAYRALHEAAERGSLGPTELFSLGRYLEPRGRRRQAYQLAMLALSQLSSTGSGGGGPGGAGDLAPGTELDVSWACSLALGLGSESLSEMLAQLVRRVRSPLLLAEVLHRCRLSPVAAPSSTNSGGTGASKMFLPLAEPPLLLLLNATVDAFMASTHARLANISPRHYSDFLDFLYKARDVFHLVSPDGAAKFRHLVAGIRHSHRGKKKLNCLLKERFLYEPSSL